MRKLGAIIVMVGLVGLAVPAFAHDVYQNVWTWNENARCLRDKPLINLENNYFSWVTATPHQENPVGNPCTVGDWPWNLSAGYISVKTELYDQDGAAYCMQLPQIWNATKSAKLEQQHHWKVANIRNCLVNGNGNGYVGIWGYAQVFYNSQWKPAYPGDWVWSGYHWCCTFSDIGSPGPRRPAPPETIPAVPPATDTRQP